MGMCVQCLARDQVFFKGRNAESKVIEYHCSAGYRNTALIRKDAARHGKARRG